MVTIEDLVSMFGLVPHVGDYLEDIADEILVGYDHVVGEYSYRTRNDKAEWKYVNEGWREGFVAGYENIYSFLRRNIGASLSQSPLKRIYISAIDGTLITWDEK